MGIRFVVRPKDPPTGSGPEITWPFEFEQERVLFGRGAGADVSLPERAISSRHASVRAETSARVVIVDHGSTNGTRVNGQALIAERPRVLRDGDVLEMGPFRIEVRLNVAVAAPTSRERTVSLARRILEHRAEGPPTRPRLVVLNGTGKGRELGIPQPPARLRIGRAETCALQLDDADASREHAELVVDLDGVTIRDLGSKNGIEIAGRRVHERRLKDRDELVIGATVLAFEDPTEHLLKERELDADWAMPPPAAPSTPPAPSPSDATDAPSQAPPSEALAEPPLPPPELTDPHREPAPIAPPPAPRWQRRSFTVEVFVLLVAAAVLSASAVGLYYLLASS